MKKTPPVMKHRAPLIIRDQRGGAAIETALVLPAFMLMIVGTIYAGWLLWSTNTLYFAVESAARCASVNATECGTVSSVQSFAVTQAIGLNVTTANFTVTQPTCGWQVSATYPFLFLLPFETNFNVNITAQACYPVM